MPGLTIPRDSFKIIMAGRFQCDNIDNTELTRMIQGFLLGFASQAPWGGILKLDPIKDILSGKQFPIEDWRR